MSLFWILLIWNKKKEILKLSIIYSFRLFLFLFSAANVFHNTLIIRFDQRFSVAVPLKLIRLSIGLVTSVLALSTL